MRRKRGFSVYRSIVRRVGIEEIWSIGGRVNSITHRERRLIEETVKVVIANQWALTPETVWGFLVGQGESIDKVKVEYILQEQQAEGTRR
jgi:hypothetical protein